jgi:hypothetical protein
VAGVGFVFVQDDGGGGTLPAMVIAELKPLLAVGALGI